MSEAEQQLVCQKLDMILQHGTAEQQSLYMDAVQSMAWSSHSFDDAQREAYNYFLDNSARCSQSAEKVGAVMDALTSGGTVTLDLAPADGIRGGAYTVRVSDGTGTVRAKGFAGNFYWATAAKTDPSGSSVTLQSQDGGYAITAWEGSSIIRCKEPGETVYLVADATSSAPYDGNTAFTYLRKWYDEAEYTALVSAVTVPDGGSRAGHGPGVAGRCGGHHPAPADAGQQIRQLLCAEPGDGGQRRAGAGPVRPGAAGGRAFCLYQ